MYPIIKFIHSYFAYLVLAGLLYSIVYFLAGFIGKKTFSKRHQKIALISMTLAHVQFIFGLIIYFVSPMGIMGASSAFMKNSILRLYVLEHPAMMILGLVLITIGYSKSKRVENDKKKFKTLLLFYSIGFLFILSRIPWQEWL